MNNSETNTSSNTTAAGTSSINNSAASAPKVKRSFKSQNFNAKLGNQTKQPPVNGSPSLSHKQAQPPASTSPAPGVTQTSHIGAAGAHSNASALSNNSNSNPDTDIQSKLDALQKKLDEQNALIEAMMKMTAMSQGGAPAPAGGVGTTSSFNVAGNQNPTLQQQQTSAWAQQNRPWAPKPAPVSTSASDVRAFGSADEKSQEEIDKELAAFKTKSQRQGSMLKAQTTVEGKKDLENMLFGKDRHGTQGIDFEKYEAIPVETSGRDIPEALEHGFSTNIFSDNLMHNIERAQYFTPTPIQRYSIPMVLAGRDVMACAQTGSGKTAAFLFPIITKLEQGKIIHTSRPATGFGRRTACPRGLVLAPTRELSSQIHEEAMRFTYESPLRTIVTYGGAEIRDQMRELSNGCDILVATPGRLVDLVQRGAVSLRNVSFLVLDEADRMLDMGFEPQVRQIVSSFDMPSTEDGRQTSMFSATFPKEIQRLAQDFLGDYLFVTVGRVGSTTTTIEQRLVWIEPERKLDELVQQLKKVPGLTLVFVSMKKDCDRIEHQLNSSGIRAVSIHGDRVQREREYSLEMFMSGKARVLVATDVAARGLDINDVSHVINFDVPSEIDTYVHRIGRTGRAGNKGIATTFFNEQDAKIAPLLLDTLEEAGQTIPSWLRSVAEQVKEGAMRSRGERGGRRGGGGDRFGAKDVRDIGSKPSSTSTPSTTAPPATSGGGGSRGGRGLRRGGAGGANHSNGAKTVTDAW